VLALLPNLSAEPLRTSLFEVVNDQHLNLYVASLVRAVTSLHDLVENKRRVGSLLDEGDKAAGAKKGGEEAKGEKEGAAKGDEKPKPADGSAGKR
jgi:hypothetical protein